MINKKEHIKDQVEVVLIWNTTQKQKNHAIINHNADTDDELYSRRQEIKENDELINKPGFNHTQNLEDKMFNEDS